MAEHTDDTKTSDIDFERVANDLVRTIAKYIDDGDDDEEETAKEIGHDVVGCLAKRGIVTPGQLSELEDAIAEVELEDDENEDD